MVLREPFTSTDRYLYMDSFFIGLKLDDFYDFSDSCIDAWVFTANDRAYFSNNKTLVADDPEEFWLHPLLNFTGAMAGPMSDITPECYQFYKSVRETEADRWERFDKSWSNYFLAFLFNQMGNALNFQQKFENIRLNRETQNYQGVWLEYGDLIHIIYDFEPLEDAALLTVDEYVARYIDDSHLLDDSSPVESYLLKAGMTGFAHAVARRSDDFMAQMPRPDIASYAAKVLEPVKKVHREAKRLTAPAFEGG